jgi:phage-related protein
MARNRNVNVVIKGDYDNSDVQRAIRELQKLGNVADDQNHKFSTLGKVGAVAAAAGLAIAAKATIDFASASVDAAQEAQVADARFAQVAKQMGFVDGAFAGATKRANEYAGALSKQIGIEDESIKAVQAKLLTFKAVGQTVDEAGGQFDRATQAAYDLAATGFGTAESNATQLGKALQDPIKGLASLSRAGVTFTATEKDTIKALVESGQAGKAQEMVLKAIETQVGGTAAATATSAAKMKVSFSELQESVGGALLPVLNEFADTLVPIFDSLQGPLTAVAKSVADVLGGALKAIAPLLPTLAESLGKLAGSIGTILTTAISALIPVLTPLLTVFSDLASRIGPLLAPLLEKIGELLGKVLSAVLPLLQPLIDLVFTILEAAMPILDVVVDLFGVLVDALKPLLTAVGMLLGPLGELVNVIFKALEPILRPLIPLLTLIAGVLADVLTRAIGLITYAIGNLILAFSRLAPFVLENVTKPVVSFFLTMAEQIVGSAAEAFSWIPGLGDKLNEAKGAIGKFKVDSTKAIGDAAKTISTEGEKIGKGLIDQGVQAMSDPASISRVKTAGIGVGMSLSDGMAVGIRNGQIPIQAAATTAINGAEQAARAAAQSNSPSLVFAAIGKDLTAGLVQGVQEGGKDVRKTLQESFSSWFSETVDKLKEKLTEAQDAFKSFKDEVSNAITGGIDFAGAAQEFDDQGNKVGQSFIEKLTLQAEQAKNFALKVKELIAAGLSQEALQQVLAAGVNAGTVIINELIAGGVTAISTTNDLVKSTQDAADSVGELAAEKWYGAGVTSAESTLSGFREAFGKDGKSRAALMRVMDNLADAAARNVRINVDVVENVTRKVTTIMSNGQPQVQGASGGIVNVPTVALIGEAGPEAVIPLDRSPGNGPVSNLGGGNSYSITVQAGVGDPRQIGQQVVEYIKRFEASNGNVFVAA